MVLEAGARKNFLVINKNRIFSELITLFLFKQKDTNKAKHEFICKYFFSMQELRDLGST